MAKVIPLPVDYIVFETVYMPRIPDKNLQLLTALLERESDAQPLYFHNTLWKDDRVLLTENLDLAETPSSAELDELQRAVSAILGEHESGTIAFRSDHKHSFQQIFVLIDILCHLHYFYLFFVENIRYAEATISGRPVRLAIVGEASNPG